jgi:hypothetical protein
MDGWMDGGMDGWPRTNQPGQPGRRNLDQTKGGRRPQNRLAFFFPRQGVEVWRAISVSVGRGAGSRCRGANITIWLMGVGGGLKHGQNMTIGINSIKQKTGRRHSNRFGAREIQSRKAGKTKRQPGLKETGCAGHPCGLSLKTERKSKEIRRKKNLNVRIAAERHICPLPFVPRLHCELPRSDFFS